MARRTMEVELDLSGLSAEDLRAECRSRGVDDSFGCNVSEVAELAHAIAAGSTDLAFHYLESIFSDSKSLRHAIDIGRRRVR